MADIHTLMAELAQQEQALQTQTFLAPCLPGGKVRTRIAGMIYTFDPEPKDREGWGLFQARTPSTATWLETAAPYQVDEYLHLLRPLRLHLCLRLQGRTWLAYPMNESDACQRLGACRPLPVHLVDQGTALETVIAGWDGTAFWFQDLDRRADPQLAEYLRQQLNAGTALEQLRYPGLSPEQRSSYSLALGGLNAYHRQRRQRSDQARLQAALKLGGGQLDDFQDQGEYWLVSWRTGDGKQHNSAIAKNDLTVISAGICLDGEDRHFDLQSLTGVMEQAPDWA